MEKTADELFEELGYEKLETDKFTFYDLKYNDKYQKSRHIRIDLESQNIQCLLSWYDGDKNYHDGSLLIRLKELKAINKFCEEKGWEE